MLAMNCCCYQCHPVAQQAMKVKNKLFYGSDSVEHCKSVLDQYTTIIDNGHIFEVFIPMDGENYFGGLPLLFEKDSYPPRTTNHLKFLFNSTRYHELGKSETIEHLFHDEDNEEELLHLMIETLLEEQEWRYCIVNINAHIQRAFPCPGKIGTSLTLCPLTFGISLIPLIFYAKSYVTEALLNITDYLKKVNKKLLDRSIDKKLNYSISFDLVIREDEGVSWVQCNIYPLSNEDVLKINPVSPTQHHDDIAVHGIFEDEDGFKETDSRQTLSLL
ncbi:hypothetical protein ABK040_002100 [Willaertia magna]